MLAFCESLSITPILVCAFLLHLHNVFFFLVSSICAHETHNVNIDDDNTSKLYNFLSPNPFTKIFHLVVPTLAKLQMNFRAAASTSKTNKKFDFEFRTLAKCIISLQFRFAFFAVVSFVFVAVFSMYAAIGNIVIEGIVERQKVLSKERARAHVNVRRRLRVIWNAFILFCLHCKQILCVYFRLFHCLFVRRYDNNIQWLWSQSHSFYSRRRRHCRWWRF